MLTPTIQYIHSKQLEIQVEEIEKYNPSFIIVIPYDDEAYTPKKRVNINGTRVQF